MYFIFHKVASVLYEKYSTVMQIIVVVIGVKFQMLIAVTNWFRMKSIAYLLKMHKIEFFLLSTTLFLHVEITNRRN